MTTPITTARALCAALAADGHDADPGCHAWVASGPLPAGILPGGRAWVISAEAGAGFTGPDEPLPGRLDVRLYGSAVQSPLGLRLNQAIGALAGCTPRQAAAAIRQAAAGDYSGFQLGQPAGQVLRALPGLPENLTTLDGAPMFDERTRTYLHRVRQAAPAAIAAWRTAICPECGSVIYGDGLVLDGHGITGHVLMRGAVVLGCEGLLVVDPGAVGLDRGPWQDWRAHEPDGAYLNLDPDQVYRVTLFGAYVGGPAGSYPEALAMLREAAGDPIMAEAIESAGGLRVFYVSRITGLYAEFPVPLTEIREAWDRPIRPQDEAWFAALPPHIAVEALCLLCGDTFCPDGPDDMTHQQHDEQPCGGPGVPLGAWGLAATAKEE